MGTWNIRGLNGKEEELLDEFEKLGLNILAITETKKKGRTSMEQRDGHLLILSGVKVEERAQAGVGCLIERNIVEFVKKWEFYSERILKLEIETDKKQEINITIIYGPNEDDRAAVKDEFWAEVTEIVDNAKDRTIILGDLNGRVGRRLNDAENVIGKHGENIRNKNGRRIIEFCTQNNLLVMNTFFQHK